MEELTKEEKKLKDKIIDLNIWIRDLDYRIYNWKQGIRNLGYREDKGVSYRREKFIYEMDGEEIHAFEAVRQDQKEVLKKMIEKALKRKEHVERERDKLREEFFRMRQNKPEKKEEQPKAEEDEEDYFSLDDVFED